MTSLTEQKGAFMGTFGLILFGLYLLAMIVLDIAMIISLLKPGDERRQMIVWKASTWTLAGITGSLVFRAHHKIPRNAGKSLHHAHRSRHHLFYLPSVL